MSKLFCRSSLMWCACLLALANCQDEPPVVETKRVEKLLTETSWNLRSVTVDDMDQSGIYAGLKITFTSTGYATENGKGIWPASDSWSFTDNTAKTFVRGDGVEIAITEITQKALKLQLTWETETFTGGRVASIKGKHVFAFTR